MSSAGGEEYLWYKVPAKIDVAIIRGTTADVAGNITFEKEAMLADCLNQVHGICRPRKSKTLKMSHYVCGRHNWDCGHNVISKIDLPSRGYQQGLQGQQLPRANGHLS